MPGQLIWESSAHAGYCPGRELVSDSVHPVRIVDVDGNVDETHHPLRFRSLRGELAVGLCDRLCSPEILRLPWCWDLDDNVDSVPPLVQHPCGIHIGRVQMPCGFPVS